jgi:putative phosphoribosyl transferase
VSEIARHLHNRKTRAKVRIVCRSGVPFRNRVEAGLLLVKELLNLKGQNAVVLGVPRGGIVIAEVVARGIDADLDIVLSRKLGAPGQSELAVGALAENGDVFLNERVVDGLSVSDSYIEQEKARQTIEIQRRSRLIRSVLPRVPLQGRIVVVTDDGVATGATLQAAVWAINDENPQKIIAAIPVASAEAVERLAEDVDEIVCLRLPEDFMAVGQFFSEFNQVTDDEVVSILRQEVERKAKKNGIG